MYDTASLQVLQGVKQLKDYFANSFLWYLEVPLFQIVEEVFTLCALQYYIEEMRSLEKIHQSYNVSVLAPFQNVKLPLLLSHLNNFHTSFLDSFDRDKLPSLEMLSGAYLAKLPLTKRTALVKSVEIKERSIACLIA